MGFKEKWEEIPPKSRKVVTWGGIICGLFFLSWLIIGDEGKARKQVHEEDRVGNIFNSGSLLNVTTEGLYAQLRDLTADIKEIKSKNVRLEKDLQLARDNITKTQAARKIQNLEETIGKLQNEIQAVRERPSRRTLGKQEEDPYGAIADSATQKDQGETNGDNLTSLDKEDEEPKVVTEENLFDTPSDDIEELSYTQPPIAPGASGAKNAVGAPSTNKMQGKNQVLSSSTMHMVTLENDQSKLIEESTELTGPKFMNIFDKTKPFLPMGSLLSGVTLSGVDAPTGEGARQNPVPVLIRIKELAVLSNRFKMDLRECFILTSGHGDYSSQRVKLRGEGMSCVRENGDVIETAIQAFVTGEDGKEGIRGRLVSKQGSLLGSAATAGFIGGMANAFDVNAVPTINTAGSGGKQAYDQVFSRELRQSALVGGATGAMERIADFYIKMAEETFPVIETGAGRNITIILTKGLSLLPLTDKQGNSQQALPKENTLKKVFGSGGNVIGQRMGEAGNALMNAAK